MQLELQALGTQFQADKDVQDSFARYFDGAMWMTYTNVMTKVVHWDLVRFARECAARGLNQYRPT